MQLDCLCKNDIETDESIRRSLKDMPKDLYTLFSRILHRAKITGPSFQSRLLKIILAAQRPLTLDEMREALSIVPADATWKPQQQINNISRALASCGSLVTVDEEEATVQFVHQSVSQFLLQDADDVTPLDWHFTFRQANLELGQLLVTYLSYGIFDQQLSTTVVPNISAGQAPTMVVQHVLKDGPWKKAAALKLLRLRSLHDPDLGRAITEVSGAYRASSETTEVFHLLTYARKYWLHHTRTISPDSPTFSLCRDLLSHPTFGKELHAASRSSHARLLWSIAALGKVPMFRYRGPDRRPLLKFTVVNEAKKRYDVYEFSPRVIWAITNSHLGLLSVELTGKHALKALCSVVFYLLNLQQTNYRTKLERPMWQKLWTLANAVGMYEIATEIFRECDMAGQGRSTEQHDPQNFIREWRNAGQGISWDQNVHWDSNRKPGDRKRRNAIAGQLVTERGAAWTRN